MKLVRHGAGWAKKPGLIDAGGVLRGLSGTVAGFGPSTPTSNSMSSLAALDTAGLSHVGEGTRPGACVGMWAVWSVWSVWGPKPAITRPGPV